MNRNKFLTSRCNCQCEEELKILQEQLNEAVEKQNNLKRINNVLIDALKGYELAQNNNSKENWKKKYYEICEKYYQLEDKYAIL